MLRLGPGQGASQISSTCSKFYGDKVVDLVCHACPCKTDQNSSIADKLGDTIMIGTRDFSDIGEDEHRRTSTEQSGDGAFVDVGVRRERALKIVDIGQKRL